MSRPCLASLRYFDSHADIKTKSVELSGDSILEYVACTGESIFGEGENSEYKHLQYRFVWSQTAKRVLALNTNDQTSVLKSPNGASPCPLRFFALARANPLSTRARN